jgi:hypothetical protein
MGEISGGKLAMWVIGGSIVLASIVALALLGIGGYPWGWTGLIVAAILAAVAFALGEWE